MKMSCSAEIVLIFDADASNALMGAIDVSVVDELCCAR
jgi:hypothetical protein